MLAFAVEINLSVEIYVCVSIVRAKVLNPSVLLWVRITQSGHWILVATYGSEQGSRLKIPRVKMTTGGRYIYVIYACTIYPLLELVRFSACMLCV